MSIQLLLKNMENLYKQGIYVITADDGRMLLYAPIRGVVAETTPAEVEAFESQLREGSLPKELTDLVGHELASEVRLPENATELTILINQRCNFACQYCYSANGRSSAELSEALFEPIVKWFVSPAKKGGNLTVTFSGGGDPMLSFPRVRCLVELMRRQAEIVGATVQFGMVCNGSRLSDDDISFIRRNFSNLVISFDVIPEVHDAQRSHYHEVADTLRRLIDSDVKFGLRSTITSLNVDRMPEMIETLHRDFPRCKSIATEAVLSPRMWADESSLHDFYTKFVDNYFKAQALADEYGISLGNTVELSYDSLKTRACEAKVVVTPEGFLTACSRVATPGDSHFNEFSFGRITESGVTYDAEKYNRIMRFRAENFGECHECFARYHCGGGCMLARLSYSSAQMRLHCDFTRQILKHKIFQ